MAALRHSHVPCRGQSIKVFSQLLRKARSKQLVVPHMKVCMFACLGGWEEGQQQSPVGGSEGGRVIAAPYIHSLSKRSAAAAQPLVLLRPMPEQGLTDRAPLPECMRLMPQSSAPPSDGVGYEGATVLDPKIGYYDK